MTQITHRNIGMMRVVRCRAFAGRVSVILAANRKVGTGARWLTTEGERW